MDQLRRRLMFVAGMAGLGPAVPLSAQGADTGSPPPCRKSVEVPGWTITRTLGLATGAGLPPTSDVLQWSRPEGSDDVLTELKLQFDSADGQVREGKVTLHAEGSLTSDEALRPLQIGLYWVEAGDVFLGASSVSNRVRMPSPGPDGHVRWSSRTTLILGRNMTGWLYAAVVNGQTLKTTTLVPNETGQDVRAHRRRFDLGQLRHAPRLLKRMGRELAREADEGLCSVARSGCYLTSVCCGMVGLADDCLELRVLRRFRDGWLRQQPGGPAEIDEYRRIAPRIAAALWTAPDAAGQGRRIYLRFILPSVLLILCGQRRRAWMRYRQMVRDLERTCGPRA